MTDAEDKEAALEKLETLAQPDVEPTISNELEEILDRHKRASRWVTATALVYGDIILPTVRNGHVYRVITAGTTTTEPTWPTTDESTVTVGAEFEEAGTDYENVYDLRGALRECWELKMAKASEFISSQDSGSEQMIYEQCMRMAERYKTPMVV